MLKLAGKTDEPVSAYRLAVSQKEYPVMQLPTLSVAAKDNNNASASALDQDYSPLQLDWYKTSSESVSKRSSLRQN